MTLVVVGILPTSIFLPSFMYRGTVVSVIREFNWTKKLLRKRKILVHLFSMVKNEIFNQTYM